MSDRVQQTPPAAGSSSSLLPAAFTITGRLDSSEEFPEWAQQSYHNTVSDWLRRSEGRVTIPDLAVALPAMPWNPSLLEHGELRLFSDSAEVFLRFALAAVGQQWTTSRLLSFALKKHMEFKIVVPIARIALFAPNPISARHKMLGEYYNMDAQGTLTPYHKASRDVAKQYKARVLDILHRPHARAIWFNGGLIARIATHFAGDETMEQARQGFSIQSTVFGHGKVLFENSAQFTDDKLPEFENDVLMGVLQGNHRTLWPSEALFRQVMHWEGWWTPKMEDFFADIIQGIMGNDPKLYNHSGWKDYLRRQSDRYVSKVKTPVPWADILKEMTALHGTSLRAIKVADIVIPDPVRNWRRVWAAPDGQGATT